MLAVQTGLSGAAPSTAGLSQVTAAVAPGLYLDEVVDQDQPDLPPEGHFLTQVVDQGN
jgi:hypothetical protein|tara:strand:+ start:7320 stop:7493 length:174 start_codon:yes stop_codon:yes gene_type:complete